jgi:uncharacterized protein YjbI with pentapeptide repeats/energy-coupling factor transporter ATP-binding protein EcfA2
VTPRAALPGGDPLPLHDQVRRVLRGDPGARVALVGPPGAGKTAALRHLAATLPPDSPVVLVDDDGSFRVGQGAHGKDRVFITAARRPPLRGDSVVLGLAPWDTDHLIEYLLATRRDRCTSVMNRLKDAPPADLSGLPELWSAVLDAMAADGSLATPAEALRHVLAARLGDHYLRHLATDFCVERVLRAPTAEPPPDPPGYFRHVDPLVARLIRHHAVQVILAAQRIVWDLPGAAAVPEYLDRPLPPELVREVAALAAFRPRVMRALRGFVCAPRPMTHATAATILHATRTGWRPDGIATPHLARASLAGANWPGINLSGAALRGADLSGAALAASDLDDAAAGAAVFRGACLRGAWLRRLRAACVDFGGADLAESCADRAHLDGANLSAADLSGASFRAAYLRNANLEAARLVGTDLRDARLDHAVFGGADLTGADLGGASLAGVDLCGAVLSGADFSGARLTECDLQGVRFRNAHFRKADLSGADLTGCFMPGADFRRAVLCRTGLADVGWHDADLRGADLTGASFHLGSARSGLVGSVVPCEGSRTGFYADEYEEQYYRPPEEVRKADLRGADLRGARVKDTDFYLVDLRGARDGAEQARHFRQCGAIL